MAAIGTGAPLSNDRVRQFLARCIHIAEWEKNGSPKLETFDTTGEYAELARALQELIDRRTADGINESIAKRVEPLQEALDIANEVIRSLGGNRVEADFSKIDAESAHVKGGRTAEECDEQAHIAAVCR